MAPSSGGPGSKPQQQHENRSGSKPIGEHFELHRAVEGCPSRDDGWGEFACPLGPAVTLTARSAERLFRLVLGSHDGRAQVPIPKRSTSPRATSTPYGWIV